MYEWLQCRTLVKTAVKTAGATCSAGRIRSAHLTWNSPVGSDLPCYRSLSSDRRVRMRRRGGWCEEREEKGSRDTAVRSEHGDVAKASVCGTVVQSQDDRVSRGRAGDILFRRHICTKNTKNFSY